MGIKSQKWIERKEGQGLLLFCHDNEIPEEFDTIRNVQEASLEAL